MTGPARGDGGARLQRERVAAVRAAPYGAEGRDRVVLGSCDEVTGAGAGPASRREQLKAANQLLRG